MSRIFRLCLPLVLWISACAPAASNVKPSQPPSAWQQDATFYEIFVRSFYDSDGDGIGDFNGIVEKLDYLNDGDPNTTDDLGVTAIWLMPIFPSPSYHGYDVTDYYTVNPQYGALEDFERLLEEAHKRGIRVIIDLIINHTSDQHPWFRDAKRNKDSEYRDWYIWNDTKPNYQGPWGENVWHSSTTGFYYGIFTQNMPDLNFNNPKVTQEIENVMKFWLQDVGVDGFRMDAIKHLIEETRLQENTASTHQWLEQNFYPAYKSLNPDAFAIGELFGNDMNSVKKYFISKQFDMAFNFQLAHSFINSANSHSASYARRALDLSAKVLSPGEFAPFLTNHDQERVMTTLRGDIGKAKIAASLLLTSPGTPFIYYGEEIGMQGDKPDENIRRPMQWSANANAGFTTGTPWRAPDSNYAQVNVAAQTDDSASLLSHYRALIQLRNALPPLQVGSYISLQTNMDRLFASLRVGKDDAVLTLVNLGEEPLRGFMLQAASTPLMAKDYSFASVYGAPLNVQFSTDSNGAFTFTSDSTLPAYETIILHLK